MRKKSPESQSIQNSAPEAARDFGADNVPEASSRLPSSEELKERGKKVAAEMQMPPSAEVPVRTRILMNELSDKDESGFLVDTASYDEAIIDTFGLTYGGRRFDFNDNMKQKIHFAVLKDAAKDTQTVSELKESWHAPMNEVCKMTKSAFSEDARHEIRAEYEVKIADLKAKIRALPKNLSNERMTDEERSNFNDRRDAFIMEELSIDNQELRELRSFAPSTWLKPIASKLNLLTRRGKMTGNWTVGWQNGEPYKDGKKIQVLEEKLGLNGRNAFELMGPIQKNEEPARALRLASLLLAVAENNENGAKKDQTILDKLYRASGTLSGVDQRSFEYSVEEYRELCDQAESILAAQLGENLAKEERAYLDKIYRMPFPLYRVALYKFTYPKSEEADRLQGEIRKLKEERDKKIEDSLEREEERWFVNFGYGLAHKVFPRIEAREVFWLPTGVTILDANGQLKHQTVPPLSEKVLKLMPEKLHDGWKRAWAAQRTRYDKVARETVNREVEQQSEVVSDETNSEYLAVAKKYSLEKPHIIDEETGKILEQPHARDAAIIDAIMSSKVGPFVRGVMIDAPQKPVTLKDTRIALLKYLSGEEARCELLFTRDAELKLGSIRSLIDETPADKDSKIEERLSVHFALALYQSMPLERMTEFRALASAASNVSMAQFYKVYRNRITDERIRRSVAERTIFVNAFSKYLAGETPLIYNEFFDKLKKPTVLGE